MRIIGGRDIRYPVSMLGSDNHETTRVHDGLPTLEGP